MKSIDLDKALADGVIKQYVSQIRERLLNGNSFKIEGVGVLTPSFRRVKNNYGRNFSIGVKLIKDKNFSEELVNNYLYDTNNFLKLEEVKEDE